MRDKGFVALHRGGELSIENHRKLIHWGRVCAEHILPYLKIPQELKISQAFEIAKLWELGEIKTGKAMESARGLHKYARTLDNQSDIAIIRSIAHAVATAHMADHSLGGGLYALKALKLLDITYDDEKNWQIDELKKLHLPAQLEVLVLNTFKSKLKSFKL